MVSRPHFPVRSSTCIGTQSHVKAKVVNQINLFIYKILLEPADARHCLRKLSDSIEQKRQSLALEELTSKCEEETVITTAKATCRGETEVGRRVKGYPV